MNTHFSGYLSRVESWVSKRNRYYLIINFFPNRKKTISTHVGTIFSCLIILVPSSNTEVGRCQSPAMFSIFPFDSCTSETFLQTKVRSESFLSLKIRLNLFLEGQQCLLLHVSFYKIGFFLAYYDSSFKMSNLGAKILKKHDRRYNATKSLCYVVIYHFLRYVKKFLKNLLYDNNFSLNYIIENQRHSWLCITESLLPTTYSK